MIFFGNTPSLCMKVCVWKYESAMPFLDHGFAAGKIKKKIGKVALAQQPNVRKISKYKFPIALKNNIPSWDINFSRRERSAFSGSPFKCSLIIRGT